MRTLVFVLAIGLVVSLTTIGEAVQDKGMVLYYSFDEGMGKKVKDLSGNGFDGEISGNPQWVDGKFFKALCFTGVVNEYVQIKEILPIGSTDSTVAMWIKVPKTAAGRVGILLGNYPDVPNSNWEIHAKGEMRIWWNNGHPDIKAVTDLRDDEWHHLTFIRDKAKNRFAMYIDGKKEFELIATAGDDIEFTTLHRVGGDNRGDNSPWLQATIDELVIFDRVLSEDEIRDLMKSPVIIEDVRPSGKLGTVWGRIKNL